LFFAAVLHASYVSTSVEMVLKAFCFRAVRACVRASVIILKIIITISYKSLVRISPKLQLWSSWGQR